VLNYIVHMVQDICRRSGNLLTMAINYPLICRTVQIVYFKKTEYGDFPGMNIFNDLYMEITLYPAAVTDIIF
jgi:hypothetical protein